MSVVAVLCAAVSLPVIGVGIALGDWRVIVGGYVVFVVLLTAAAARAAR